METCKVEKVDDNKDKGDEVHGPLEADPEPHLKPTDEPLCQERCGKRKVMECSEEENVYSSMYDRLFEHCTNPKLIAERPQEHLVSMMRSFLTQYDLECMKRSKWVNNMIFYLAGRCFMYDELKETGCVKRYILDPSFAETLARDELVDFRHNKPKEWNFRTIKGFASQWGETEKMKSAKWIFAPALFEEHWFCYVVDQEERIMYVLDSMLKKKQSADRNLLDNAMRKRFKDLMRLLERPEGLVDGDLRIVRVDLPQQRNTDDCGIYVLKYLEMWDGGIKCEGKTMPDFSLRMRSISECWMKQVFTCNVM